MRKNVIILFALALSYGLMAQEQFKHEKKMFKAADGKLYCNKKLPIYLWVSTSPDPSSEKIKLESEDSRAYVNPFYFDTEGFNSIRTPSKVDTVTKKVLVPLQDILWEVYADSYSPTTSIQYVNAALYRKEKNLYVADGLKVGFRAEDALSGIEKTFYSVDSSAFQEYKDSLSFPQEKEYVVKFYSVDNVGNAEPTTTKKFTIDKTAPLTKLEYEGDQSGTVISMRSKIKLLPYDGVSGVKKTMVSIDNGKEFTYAAPIAASYYKEGEHTISFYSVDNLGNTEPAQKISFFIDKTPPILIDEVLGDSYFVNGREYTSGRTQLKLTALDNKAGVAHIYYTTDGKTYNEYTTPFGLPNKEGSMVINFYAVDKVNNKTQSHGEGTKFHTTFMDLKGPRLGHKYQGLTFKNRDTVFINAQTKVFLYATDDESGVKEILYSSNTDKEQTYTQPLTYAKEGKYTLSYRGYDNVNNSSFSSFWFIVDKTGPDIFERFSIEPIGQKSNMNIYPSHTVVFLSATDKDCGFDRLQVSINDRPYAAYTGYINNLAKNTKYKIKVKAYDKLGNSKETVFEFMTGD